MSQGSTGSLSHLLELEKQEKYHDESGISNLGSVAKQPKFKSCR